MALTLLQKLFNKRGGGAASALARSTKEEPAFKLCLGPDLASHSYNHGCYLLSTSRSKAFLSVSRCFDVEFCHLKQNSRASGFAPMDANQEHFTQQKCRL